MIQRTLTKEQKEYAWDQVNRNSMAHRGVFDGNKEHQYTGLLGEIVVADELGLERPTTSRGFDNGIDLVFLNVAFDVKTVGRNYDPRREWVNNLVASQMKYATQAYLFASINKRTSVITYTGLISKHDAERYELHLAGTSRMRDDGKEIILKTDQREIPNSHLHPLDRWDDMIRFCLTVHNSPTPSYAIR
jgi:hypothetical protein